MSKGKSPKLDAKQEGQREQITGAPQRRPPAAHRIQALPLAAVHQERKRDAGEHQEDRGTDAAEELRKHERPVGSQVGSIEGMKYVALQHHHDGRAARPIQERQAAGWCRDYLACCDSIFIDLDARSCTPGGSFSCSASGCNGGLIFRSL